MSRGTSRISTNSSTINDGDKTESDYSDEEEHIASRKSQRRSSTSRERQSRRAATVKNTRAKFSVGDYPKKLEHMTINKTKGKLSSCAELMKTMKWRRPTYMPYGRISEIKGAVGWYEVKAVLPGRLIVADDPSKSLPIHRYGTVEVDSIRYVVASIYMFMGKKKDVIFLLMKNEMLKSPKTMTLADAVTYNIRNATKSTPVPFVSTDSDVANIMWECLDTPYINHHIKPTEEDNLEFCVVCKVFTCLVPTPFFFFFNIIIL